MAYGASASALSSTPIPTRPITQGSYVLVWSGPRDVSSARWPQRAGGPFTRDGDELALSRRSFIPEGAIIASDSVPLVATSGEFDPLQWPLAREVVTHPRSTGPQASPSELCLLGPEQMWRSLPGSRRCAQCSWTPPGARPEVSRFWPCIVDSRSHRVPPRGSAILKQGL